MKVSKIECTNHCIKNYSKQLFAIKNNTKGVALAARKLLTQKKIIELVEAAKRSIQLNAQGDVGQLKKDIRNSVSHVFGDHSMCRQHLCETVGEIEESKMDELKDTGCHHHVYSAVASLLAKAHLLIENETNNRAELFMSILARFNMGKRLNLIQRGSFQTRSYLTGLRYNKGPSWHTSPWKKHFKKSPGSYMKKYMAAQVNKLKRRIVMEQPKARKKLKFYSSPKKTQTDYGPNIADITLSETELQAEVEHLIKTLEVSCKREL